jgi:outer membrane lipoprotein-sorting protein
MSAPRAWDRAASLPVPAGRPARPEIVALRSDVPSVDALFTFMRDAERRFETLRMRIEERTWGTGGEQLAIHELTLRHPGEAKVLSSIPTGGADSPYRVWVSDGQTVRTYTSSRKVGTVRPVRARVRGVADARDLPGSSRVYVPVTALPAESLPELFVHPAGFCQNVLGTGSLRIVGTTVVAGREAIAVECDHPRTIEVAADRPDFRIEIAVDRADGVILRLEESVAGLATREAVVTSYEPGASIAPSAFSFTIPAGATRMY